jgi:hypothetical protein
VTNEKTLGAVLVRPRRSPTGRRPRTDGGARFTRAIERRNLFQAELELREMSRPSLLVALSAVLVALSDNVCESDDIPAVPRML